MADCLCDFAVQFHDALAFLAGGRIEAPMVTGTIGLSGVDNAFTALADPGSHAKILIDPRSNATVPTEGQP